MRLLEAAKSAIELIRLTNDWHICVHWGQSGEDAVLFRIFGAQTDGFYVDIGAHHPKRFSNTHLLHAHRGWSGINVDANAETIGLFARMRPKDINLNCLVAESPTPVIYTEFKGNAHSTADTKRAEKLEKKGLEVVSRREMTPITLRSILQQHLPEGQEIDLLTIDIEGYDLQALRSSDWEAFRPKVVCVEDFQFSKWGEPSDIAKFMMSKQYECRSHCFDTSIYIRV